MEELIETVKVACGVKRMTIDDRKLLVDRRLSGSKERRVKNDNHKCMYDCKK